MSSRAAQPATPLSIPPLTATSVAPPATRSIIYRGLDVHKDSITIAVLPWLCAMLVFLGLITYVPEISLWLPRLLGMI